MGIFGKVFGWSDRNLGAGRGPIPRRRNGDWVLSRDVRLQAEFDADLMIEAAMLGAEDYNYDEDSSDSVTAISVPGEVAFMGKRVLPTVVNEPDDDDSGDSEYKKHVWHAPATGVIGHLEKYCHVAAHNPVFETSMILLILLEIAMVMIEISIGASFDLPMDGFEKDYKKLVLHYTTAHPDACTVLDADVPGYTGRLRFLEEVGEVGGGHPSLQPHSGMHGGVLEAMRMGENAVFPRNLSAAGEAVEAECKILSAYSIHHMAEMVSKIALSLMLFGIAVEVMAEGPKDFFCPDHIDVIHAAHLMDFVVIFSSWMVDFVFHEYLTAVGNAATILVILRLWRVVRVISGMGTFIAKQKKSELEILRIKRKLKHVYLYMDTKQMLEDYFASDGLIDADEVRMMREIKETDHSLMQASMQLAEEFGAGGGEKKKRIREMAKAKAAQKFAEKQARRAKKAEEREAAARLPGAVGDDGFEEENPALEEGKASGIIPSEPDE